MPISLFRSASEFFLLRTERRRCLNDPPLSPPLPHCLFSLLKKEKKRKRAEHTEFSHFRRERERERNRRCSVSLRKGKIFFGSDKWDFLLRPFVFILFSFFALSPLFWKCPFFLSFFGRFFHRHFGNRSVVTSTHVRFPVSYALSVLIWENRSYTSHLLLKSSLSRTHKSNHVTGGGERKREILGFLS